jgi:hypothetical protein
MMMGSAATPGLSHLLSRAAGRARCLIVRLEYSSQGTGISDKKYLCGGRAAHLATTMSRLRRLGKQAKILWKSGLGKVLQKS